jgi:DNA-binding NarL/FixJ family response regulator
MRVLVADDQSNVRYGLTVLLEEQSEIEIMGEATNFKELLRLILAECPDLILLSWELPGLYGENLMKSMRLICSDVHIVVMSSQIEAAERAIELGADDFVSKAEPPERLLEVIHHYQSVSPP